MDRASLTYKRTEDYFQSRSPPTYPRGGIEFRQQEENVLVSWLQRFVLTHAVAVVAPHCEAGGQLSEAGCDVGLPLVKLVQLPAGPPLQGHVPQQLIDVEKGFTLNPSFFFPNPTSIKRLRRQKTNWRCNFTIRFFFFFCKKGFKCLAPKPKHPTHSLIPKE